MELIAPAAEQVPVRAVAGQVRDPAGRPLTDAQLDYALSDVTHLRDVYAGLSRRLEESGRTEWLDDEMAILRYHLPFADDQMLSLTVDFLQGEKNDI